MRFGTAIAIVRKQDMSDANLVRMGDKSLMFSPDGRAFIMYGRQARSWIALFDPIGPRDAWPDLIWQFVEAARVPRLPAGVLSGFACRAFLLCRCRPARVPARRTRADGSDDL